MNISTQGQVTKQLNITLNFTYCRGLGQCMHTITICKLSKAQI